MYFVAPAAQAGKWAVLHSPPADRSLPPVIVGTFDSEEDADRLATRMNDAIGLDEELEDIPEELDRLIMALG
jgi:hypothetical protein